MIFFIIFGQIKSDTYYTNSVSKVVSIVDLLSKRY